MTYTDKQRRWTQLRKEATALAICGWTDERIRKLAERHAINALIAYAMVVAAAQQIGVNQ